MKPIIVKLGESYHKQQVCGNDTIAPLTIGRAFTSDIIVSDPYVGPTQLKLEVARDDDHDWHVRNVDDTNPVFLNKKLVESPEFGLRSGDEVTIGRTSMAVFSEDHVIGRTREFSFSNWLHHHKFKPLLAGASVVLLFALTLWMSYLETSSEFDGWQLSETAVAMVIIAMLWASGWAVAGRLLKGYHYFFSHLFFTSLCFSLIVIVADVHSYVDYIFSSVAAGQVVDWVLSILLLGLLIGFNLAFVTYSPRAFRHGLITSACIMGTIGALIYLSEEEYSNDPVHSVTVKPSYVPTTRPVSVEAFLEGYHELFDRVDTTD